MTSLQLSNVDLRFKFVLIINIESNLLFLRKRQVDGKFPLNVEKPTTESVFGAILLSLFHKIYCSP